MKENSVNHTDIYVVYRRMKNIRFIVIDRNPVISVIMGIELAFLPSANQSPEEI